jgi:hypothetical protein
MTLLIMKRGEACTEGHPHSFITDCGSRNERWTAIGPQVHSNIILKDRCRPGCESLGPIGAASSTQVPSHCECSGLLSKGLTSYLLAGDRHWLLVCVSRGYVQVTNFERTMGAYISLPSPPGKLMWSNTLSCQTDMPQADTYVLSWPPTRTIENLKFHMARSDDLEYRNYQWVVTKRCTARASK